MIYGNAFYKDAPNIRVKTHVKFRTYIIVMRTLDWVIKEFQELTTVLDLERANSTGGRKNLLTQLHGAPQL